MLELEPEAAGALSRYSGGNAQAKHLLLGLALFLANIDEATSVSALHVERAARVAVGNDLNDEYDLPDRLQPPAPPPRIPSLAPAAAITRASSPPLASPPRSVMRGPLLARCAGVVAGCLVITTGVVGVSERSRPADPRGNSGSAAAERSHQEALPPEERAGNAPAGVIVRQATLPLETPSAQAPVSIAAVGAGPLASVPLPPLLAAASPVVAVMASAGLENGPAEPALAAISASVEGDERSTVLRPGAGSGQFELRARTAARRPERDASRAAPGSQEEGRRLRSASSSGDGGGSSALDEALQRLSRRYSPLAISPPAEERAAGLRSRSRAMAGRLPDGEVAAPTSRPAPQYIGRYVMGPDGRRMFIPGA